MSNQRSFVTTAALVGSAPLVLLVVAAGPAEAHGAPTDPASRAVACGPRGGHAGSSVCAAAVTAGGATAFEEWDNLRVAGVAGRDRQKIPDGKLCSAGLDTYKGLDLARDDWPATTLEAGASFTMTYASTIPHRGSFSVYLTKDGYDPRAPLSWNDLESKPFLTVKDPVLRNGAYRFQGRLPAGRTGRQLLYTIWRNTGTPDTYYSCSDIVLTGSRAGTGAGAGAGAGAKAERKKNVSRSSPSPSAAAGSDDPHTVPEQPAEQQRSDASRPPRAGAAAEPTAVTADSGSLPVTVAAAAGVLAVAGTAVAYLRHRRRPARVHRARRHPRP